MDGAILLAHARLGLPLARPNGAQWRAMVRHDTLERGVGGKRFRVRRSSRSARETLPELLAAALHLHPQTGTDSRGGARSDSRILCATAGKKTPSIGRPRARTVPNFSAHGVPAFPCERMA